MKRPCAIGFALLLLWIASIDARAQAGLPARFEIPSNPIELRGASGPRVYFEAIGRKAALMGREPGVFESWIFPLKLLHDARMSIRVEGQDTPVEFAAAIESVVVRPESTTLTASNQLFTIRATYFSPIDEAGTIVLLDVDTARPLNVTVSFVPDLKPMWPAGLGGQAAAWREEWKAFVITESRGKFNGLFGSPAASRGVSTPAHQLAAGALRFDIPVDPATAKKVFYPLIIAGGTSGRQPVVDLYQRLAATVEEQYRKTREHYRRLRETTMNIRTPERPLDLAFEWAKVALDKGMCENPDLGLGLIAGWGPSGNGARPGFGWFFGGDAAMNTYAMTAYGDFDGVRSALRFLGRYQRADGKIPHEISQGAAMIPWFDEFPYAYYHADTTPFFIAAVYNLYRQSGDRQFVAEIWEVLKKAYSYCLESDGDGDGILENSRAGLGASELGSLLADLHQDILLAATHIEASRAMREFGALMGDQELAAEAAKRQARGLESLNTRYWDAKTGRFAHALTKGGGRNLEETAWLAMPLFYGQADRAAAAGTLDVLAAARLSTDWGARMLSRESTAYNPIGYNNGAVWPFLTGFVAAGLYEYERPHAAFAYLRQLARLTFDHGPGYQPEILSGDYYRPLDESVPHQLFSSAMSVTPLVRGLLGLQPDAAASRLRFSPQLPASWDWLDAHRYLVGPHLLDVRLARTGANRLNVEMTKAGDEPLNVSFAPSLPLLAEEVRVVVNGKEAACAKAAGDAACPFEAELAGVLKVEISWSGGIELDFPREPAQVGNRTTSLKVIETAATPEGRIVCRLEGLSGRTYVFHARGGLRVQSVEGGRLVEEQGGWQRIAVAFPAAEEEQYETARVVLNFR